MPGFLDSGAQKLGSMVGSYRRALHNALNARRPKFLGAWADSEKWGGGDLGVMDAAQRRAITNTWLFTAMGMITREISASSLEVVEYLGEEEDAKGYPNHEFEVILRFPNPYISRQYLWQYTASWLVLDGNAYWFLAQSSDGNLAELWPLPANAVEAWPGDKDRFIDYYIFTVNGQAYNIPSEYICHFQLPNPFDIYRGLSMLQSSMLAIDSDNAMAQWNGAFFGRDNVMPSAIINMGSGDPSIEIDPTDVTEIKDDLRGEYSATARRTLITTVQELSVDMLGWNAKDMDFLAGRQFTKEEIFSALGVPSGLLDKNSTEANAQTADRVFKEKTIWPLLTLLAEQITVQVMKRFYGRMFETRFEDIRPTNRQLELEEATASKGLLTIDEVRKKYWEMPPLPQGVGHSLYTGSDPSQSEMGQGEPEAPGAAGMRKEVDQRVENVEFGSLYKGTKPSTPTRGKEVERPPYPNEEIGGGFGKSLGVAGSYSGAMVALFPPDDAAVDLALAPDDVPPGSKLIPPNDLHLTLVYLGDVERDEIPSEDVLEATRKTAQEDATPFDLGFEKISYFDAQDGYRPLVMEVEEADSLMDFQARLEGNLIDVGLKNKSSWEFNPHITLAYVPEDETDEVPPIKYFDWRIWSNEVVIAIGEEREMVMLESPGGNGKSIDIEAIKMDAAIVELRRWKSKSMKSVRRDQGAQVDFGSSVLPFDTMLMIRSQLGKRETIDEVKDLFNGVIDGFRQELKHYSDAHNQITHGIGAGHYGHAGRPGSVGGSRPAGVAMSARTGESATGRQAAARRSGLELWEQMQLVKLIPEPPPSPRKDAAYYIGLLQELPMEVSDDDVILNIDGPAMIRIEEYLADRVPDRDVEGFLKRFFHPPAGIEFVDSVVISSEYGTGFSAYFYDEYGEYVGKQDIGFTATTLTYSGVFVEDEHQGKGFSKITERQIVMAKIAGFERVEFYADGSIGLYAWAKKGAMYKDKDKASFESAGFKGWINDKVDDLGFPSIPDDFDYPEFKKPFDVATYKMPGLKIKGSDILNGAVPQDEVMEVGKAFMLDIDGGHGDWYAYVDLSKPWDEFMTVKSVMVGAIGDVGGYAVTQGMPDTPKWAGSEFTVINGYIVRKVGSTAWAVDVDGRRGPISDTPSGAVALLTVMPKKHLEDIEHEHDQSTQGDRDGAGGESEVSSSKEK